MAGYEGVPDSVVREQIVEVAHGLSSRGLVNAYEGNISVRKGDRVFATPTRTNKETLTAEQIIVCDLAGNRLEGELAPTSETPMHLACYELRDDVFAVVHCHAPYCTAYAQAEADFVDPASAELQVLLGGCVPCLAYGTQGTPAIIADLPNHVANHDVFFLAHHGVLGMGSTVMDAFTKVLATESLIRTKLIREQIFGQRDCALPPEEIAHLRTLW